MKFFPRPTPLGYAVLLLVTAISVMTVTGLWFVFGGRQ
jgi:hypothetical protein